MFTWHCFWNVISICICQKGAWNDSEINPGEREQSSSNAELVGDAEPLKLLFNQFDSCYCGTSPLKLQSSLYSCDVFICIEYLFLEFPLQTVLVWYVWQPGVKEQIDSCKNHDSFWINFTTSTNQIWNLKFLLFWLCFLRLSFVCIYIIAIGW